MTQRRPIEYVQFYTVGSAARKLEVEKIQLAEPVFQNAVPIKRKKVYVDPVAICGMLVAFCMLLTLFVGFFHLRNVQQDRIAMENYVIHLQHVNAERKEIYHDAYNLEEVEKTARALGMVPVDQVAHRTIDVTEPMPEDTISVWEQVGTFLSGLFA